MFIDSVAYALNSQPWWSKVASAESSTHLVAYDSLLDRRKVLKRSQE